MEVVDNLVSRSESTKLVHSSAGRESKMRNSSREYRCTPTPKLTATPTLMAQRARRQASQHQLLVQQQRHQYTNNHRLAKFRQVARLIGLCYRWSQRALTFYKINIHRFISFANVTPRTRLIDDLHLEFYENLIKSRAEYQTTHHGELMRNAHLRAEMMHFNVDYYRPSYKQSSQTKWLLGPYVRSLLCAANAGKRTSKEIRYIESQLKESNFLSGLTSTVRRRLLAECWLEEYDTNRVIVNQSRRAEFFYVVLKGTLVCTYRNPTSSSFKSRTICVMGEDSTFGELALLDASPNSTTLIAREPSQLIVLPREHFYRVFFDLSESIKSDLVEYAKENVSFLQEYPSELNDQQLLKDNIRLCKYNKRGQVIAEDTKTSPYIYIVKSGSVSVWLKLASDETQTLTSSQDAAVQDYLGYFPTNSTLRAHHDEIMANVKLNTDHPQSELTQVSGQTETQQKHSQISSEETTISYLMRSFRDEGSTSSCVSSNERDRDKLFKLPKLVAQKEPPPVRRSKQFKNLKLSKNTATNKTKNPTLLFQQPAAAAATTTRREHEKDYLKIRDLDANDHCGLEALIFGDQPSMKLICNEPNTELMLVDKELFLQHTTMSHLNQLRANELAYPNLSEIRSALKSYSNWKLFAKNFFTHQLIVTNRLKHLDRI